MPIIKDNNVFHYSIWPSTLCMPSHSFHISALRPGTVYHHTVPSSAGKATQILQSCKILLCSFADFSFVITYRTQNGKCQRCLPDEQLQQKECASVCHRKSSGNWCLHLVPASLRWQWCVVCVSWRQKVLLQERRRLCACVGLSDSGGALGPSSLSVCVGWRSIRTMEKFAANKSYTTWL